MRYSGGNSGRWLVGCLVACLVGGLAWVALAGADRGVAGASATGGFEAGLSLDLRNASLASLAASGGRTSSDEGEEGRRAAAARKAQLGSPAAVAARVRSRTEFAHLDATRAAEVAREAFSEVIERPAGGPPRLPAGQRIVRYISSKAARLELPGGKHAVVESLQPIAVETSRGYRAPVDLGLTRTGGVFASVRPLVGVLIPQRLSAGVELPEAGVSLTPVNAQGMSLGGSEGVVDGASVLYANTQTDTDTAVKPTIEGVEASTILRSVNSPDQLYFRVGMPAGAYLVQGHSGGRGNDAGSGGAVPVRVVSGGQTIALVRPPSATDAAGTSVPVSISVRGDLLVVSVSAQSGGYQWPIAVDPELAKIKDESFGPTECHQKGEAERESSNWCRFTGGSGKFNSTWYSGKAIELWNEGSANAGAYTGMAYHTQGESKIYEVEAYTDGSVKKSVARLEFARSRSVEEGEVETSEELARNGYKEFGNTRFCVKTEANGECSTSAGSAGNVGAYKLEAYEPLNETYDIDSGIQNTVVYITQEKGPEVTFDETEPTIDGGRANVLYGKEHGTGDPQAWLGPVSGALEVKAKDPGIGVAWGAIQIGGWRQEIPIWEEGKCNGVQCNEEYKTFVTYNPTMPDGEDSVEWRAADLAGKIEGCKPCLGLLGYTTELVKVDATPPEKLEVRGWPANGEISAAPHTLTIEATDGAPKENHSSGMKSITVSVDGGAAAAVSGFSCNGQCTLGPNTGKGTYTLSAEALSEGVHRLTVTATDNAGNVAATEFRFDVRHGSPVPVGPGTVDPTTGQFRLSATDVSLAGSGGVSRVYESRNPTIGAGGPIGPQWALSLGGGEGLTALPNGSVVLSSSAGATTTFTSKGKGEFESPPGDGNVKIEAKEKEAGKGITEYLLKETTAGTTTTFKQPTGTESTVPVYSNQFGAEGAEVGGPESDAVDSSGNVWVADYKNDRIEKFSSAGMLLAAYGSYGSASGQFAGPWGVAVNQSNGNVWVTDPGNNRLEELSSSGQFVEAIGWGVTNGNAEAEICTSYCRAGIAGSGNGQIYDAAGVAVDSSGNVWVVDYGNDRIEEFNEKGDFVQLFGTKGKGEVQLEEPLNIAFSGSNLYVTDYLNNRVEELSIAGKYLSQFGREGTGNSEFKGPRGIAADPRTGSLYVTDAGNNRVQEFTSSGTLIAKFGSAGAQGGQLSEPTGVAVSASGGIYVTDYNNKRVQEWTRPSWLPTVSEGPFKNTTAAYAYKAVEEQGQTVIEPTEAVAPAPAGVTCTKPEEKVVGEALKKGCRALLFSYAEKTEEVKGIRGPGACGAYVGHLNTIFFKGYNPAVGIEKMEEQAVADYSYGKKGRLCAEWDPRISPALKTFYGYDAEGHVTSLTPPGQQPWTFTYGTIAGDPNTGRLLKVTRAQPKAGASKEEILKKLEEQSEQSKNTEAPKLSGSPVVGTAITVSTGTWTNSPTVYGYQWEDCNKEGGACSTILGVNNESYTPTVADIGRFLVARITATNGGGSVVASTGAAEVTASEYKLPEKSEPAYITTGADKKLWFTDYGTSKIGTSTTTGAVTEYSLPAGSKPVGIAEGPSEEIWFADQGTSRIGKVTTKGAITEYPLSTEVAPQDLTEGPEGNMWFTASSTQNGKPNYIGKMTPSGALTQYALTAERASPTGITVGPEKYIWFTEQYLNKICVLNPTTGVIVHEYSQPNNSQPVQIVYSATEGNFWVTDYVGEKISKITPAGAISEYSVSAGGASVTLPVGITIGPDGKSWFPMMSTTGATYLMGTITSAGSITEYQLPPSSGSLYGITLGPDENLWYTGTATAHLNELNFHPQSGANHPQPGSTIEYRVPVSGTGAPYQLSSSETAKWGQKDDPTEAMAIFPPAKPMGWPAKEYERASINYMDEQGRTVDVAAPSGGISTTEYNEINQVDRTLSADNRVTALAAKEKSVEVAKELETKYTYNIKSQLAETLGPEHTVKIAKGNEKVKSGSEVPAREHVVYSYDEGSPEGKTYNLVTKTADAAETASNEEFDKRTTTTSYGGQGTLGWTLRKPTSVTKAAAGLNLTTTTRYEEGASKESTGNVVETRLPEGGTGGGSSWAFSSQVGKGDFAYPEDAAVDARGDVWVTNGYGNNIEEFASSGTRIGAYGTEGSGSGEVEEPTGVAVNQSTGNVYVADYHNSRVEEWNEKGEFVRGFGWGVSNGEAKLQTCTTGCRIGIAGSGTGQLKSSSGVAVDSSGNVWVTDGGNNRVQEFNEKGEFVRTFGWGVSNGEAKLEVCTSGCLAGTAGSGAGQFSAPTGIVVSGGHVYVADSNNGRVEELSPEGSYVAQFGTKGPGSGQLSYPGGMGVDSSGDVYVADARNNRIEEFSSSGTYITQFGSLGTGNNEFKEPEGVAVDASGNAYVADSENQRVQKWVKGSGGSGAHDTKTAYYSSEGESEVAACRNHSEWANLPCQTEPVAQTGVSGSPELPVVTFTYNSWDEVEKTGEKFGTGSGAVTRTKTQTYDPAGRGWTSEATSSPATDTALPKVTNEYNSETGILEKQSATIGGKVKTVTTVDNTLGELEKYTDAGGNTSTYSYNVEGQVEEVNDGQSEKMGVQTYAYEQKTGYLVKVVDSSAGAFTATYDLGGKMLTESYPNGLTAKYTYNPLGTATGIEYKKETHCTEKCVWFSDMVVPSIHGETLTQASTLSKESYVYDEAGRLTETQETPVGKGCRSRLYAYNEESDRTNQTTRESSTETCATEGGTVQTHSYDSANHLIDTGVQYETFGNTLTLPEADAEGHTLTSTYYLDNQVLSQTQNGTTNEYVYDPVGRTLETKSEVKATKAKSTLIAHYSGSGEALTWASEEEEKGTEKIKKWTRNIPGIDGALDAVEKSGEETKPVLQLHDLEGNIVAQAAVSETETKLLKSYNSTEFGVPNEGSAPPKYAWLGAGGVATELPSGVSTQGGASYVPQIGRNLETAPVEPPGAFPNGQGTGSQYDSEIPGWYISLSDAESATTLAEYTARQEALRRKMEEEGIADAEGSEIDPVGCVGIGGLNEESDSMTSRKSLPYLNVTCHHANPTAYLILCIIDKGLYGTGHGTWTCGKWNEIGRAYDNGKKFALVLPSFECEVGSRYQVAFGYFAFPMKEAEWHYGREQVCHPDGEEYEQKAFEESAPGKAGGD
jgi:YD repeat-containing protein